MELTDEIVRKAQSWIDAGVDEETRAEVKRMIDSDPTTLLECFYADLEFGTGGLRGLMGVGTMRMNRYTIGMATQGLANYILSQKGSTQSSVAIAFDSRNQSGYFAQTAAGVLSSNGIRVYLFAELRPTPLLSYAVRHLKCTAGIVITASHNPKEYNGYKVYWEDGAQVLPPHDTGIIREARNVQGIQSVKFTGNPELISAPGPEVEENYLNLIDGLIHDREAIRTAHDVRIVYTSIHGTGGTMVPRALIKAGFTNIHEVEKQAVPDGNFPTVVSPNPEEREALALGLVQADEIDADLLMGNDPDGDRVGIAVRNPKGDMVLLSGNQAGGILLWYELMKWKQDGRLTGKQYIASTIVTSELFPAIGARYDVPCYKTLTGFKYIARLISEKKGQEEFIAGGEESYGYLVGDFVRDKDAVISSVKFAEIAAWCAANGKSMWAVLMEIYAECGLFHDELVSVTLKGIDGMQKINAMMSDFRNRPPGKLAGQRVMEIADIESGTLFSTDSGTTTSIDLPSSNVLQFVLEDGSRISVRPSGTEPKIKFYFSFRETLKSAENYEEQVAVLRNRAAQVRKELGL